MTPLEKTLKRSLSIKGIDYVVTLSPEAIKLTGKGKRLGIELKWPDLVSGETALAIALQASVRRTYPGKTSTASIAESPPETPPHAVKRKRSKSRRKAKSSAARGA